MEEGLNKEGFALNWMLSGSRANSMIILRNVSRRRVDQTETVAVIGEEATVAHISQDSGHFCSLILFIICLCSDIME